MESNMELQVEHLCKSYRKKEALQDVSFTLRRGIYGLLGENGAGKSTLMRMMATVDFPTKGNIRYGGKDIFGMDEGYRGLIGYMPQDYNVYPGFTAKDFLEYMGVLKGIPEAKLKDRIMEVLEFVNLSEVADKKVKTFSGGMKRRIGIAQAIINEPKILILDEPTAGLDPKERIRFSNIISDMGKDKIVLLSTHIVSDIEAIATELVVVKKGKVLETGNVDELVRKVEGQVWETVVSQEVYQKLRKERSVIHIKADGKGSAGAFRWGGISGRRRQPGRADTGRLLCFCRRNHGRKFLIEREEQEMKNKKLFTAMVVFVMVTGLAGCAKESGNEPDAPIQIESSAIEDERESKEDADVSDTQKQGESQVQTPIPENDEGSVDEQTDAQLDEELKNYRQEREDMIQEANGLVEGGSPDEDNYSFDMSESFYTSRFDSRETTEAYAAARIYVTDTLGLKPSTKMVTYMCIDPRILAIYDDEDKGVAAGYDSSNIFVCEYCNGDGVWQYLILVRDGKGGAWSVIHDGSSYKE